MKKMIIVGASSGIGLAMARVYATRGFQLGLAARNIEPLKQLYDQFPQCITYASIDINREDAAEELLALVDKLGGMDTYIHVAGIGYDNPSLDPQREASMITTNAASFARMLMTAYRYFSGNGKVGHIVAVTSVAGTRGIGSMAAYSASKKCAQTYMVALEQLAKSQHCNIRFTDLRPGWITTPLLHSDRTYPMEMSLNYATRRLVKAVDRGRRVAFIDWKWRLVAMAWRLIPTWLWIRLYRLAPQEDRRAAM